MTPRLIGSAVSGLLLAGCMGNHDPNERMHSELASARDETNLHRDRSMAATTMAEEMSELDRYEMAMDPVVSEMHDALGDMSFCSASMSGMHAKTDELETMMGDHRARMTSATSVGEARDEVRAHHGSMLGLLDSMDSMAKRMSCMGHRH